MQKIINDFNYLFFSHISTIIKKYGFKKSDLNRFLFQIKKKNATLRSAEEKSMTHFSDIFSVELRKIFQTFYVFFKKYRNLEMEMHNILFNCDGNGGGGKVGENTIKKRNSFFEISN